MMYVGEIYSVLLKKAQKSEDPLDAWRIYTLIADGKKSSKYLDKEQEVMRCEFGDESYIDIEHFRREDGLTSIRETTAFYPKAFYSKKSNI